MKILFFLILSSFGSYPVPLKIILWKSVYLCLNWYFCLKKYSVRPCSHCKFKISVFRLWFQFQLFFQNSCRPFTSIQCVCHQVTTWGHMCATKSPMWGLSSAIFYAAVAEAWSAAHTVQPGAELQCWLNLLTYFPKYSPCNANTFCFPSVLFFVSVKWFVSRR